MAKKKTKRKAKPKHRIADISQSALSIVGRAMGGKIMNPPKRRSKGAGRRKK
jgi:hypothetical protein